MDGHFLFKDEEKNMKFQELTAKPNIEEIQNSTLQKWKAKKIFPKSVVQKKGEEVVFYDGPPFPTGKPHHGTVLVSFIKDMIARYWTMKGHPVPRVWGWDCHGLPIENQVESILGINDKSIIEKELGIDKFNEECFKLVSNNNESWKQYVEKMARWVDYDGAYKTMNTDFMESVMWAFKQCYDKGLIYRDYRVTPYCMHCETSLSISDTRESDSTRLRQDRWVLCRFKTAEVIEGKNVYLLAWTTTPWTLPSNLCLAVGEKLDYAYVNTDKGILVACKNTLSNYPKVFGDNPDIIKECKGSELIGKEYEPLFDYFISLKDQGAFRVVAADYVGSEEGVGIVHTAPAFGEDDYWTCKNNGIPLVNPVDEKGRFTDAVRDFYDADGEKNVIEMNPTVIRFLYEKELAVADGTIEHNYPHCWRCKRPLIYKAMDAWYLNVGKLKERLIETNEEINWVPETVKHGRFGNWLANARDWNISRNRYWSTPIPIWECECCGERKVLGSIEEIFQVSGVKLDNLHRQYMDKITFKCDKCGATMHRVPEVLDCWFESGSVPFAQKHYPFENKEWFESHYPSDFIVEYTGQIRCWFYYLHVLAVALFDKPAFKNCIVHGTILAKDGKKLSKSSKNYTDPMHLMDTYGTDALRLYLYQTNAMLLGDLSFDEAGILDAYQKILLPYWNACNFFISYANIDGIEKENLKTPNPKNQLDKWILAQLYHAEKKISENMNSYYVNKYVENLIPLVDGLTNWYIRRSRRRFWANGMSEDKMSAYETLYYVLVNMTKLFAPVAPFISERVYSTLTDSESVHLESWPNIPDDFADETLIEQVDVIQEVISLARSIRNKNNVKNRQPLNTLSVAFSDTTKTALVKEFEDVIEEEMNVKTVDILDAVEDIVDVKYNPNFVTIKTLYPERIKELIKVIKSGQYTFDGEKVYISDGEKKEELDGSIILVSYIAKDGFHVASAKGIVVSLDLNITDELKQEGIARDVIRNIQDARKNMGCDIMERIKVDISGDCPEKWLDYISAETLSDIEKIDKPDFELAVKTDDNQSIYIKIRK